MQDTNQTDFEEEVGRLARSKPYVRTTWALAAGIAVAFAVWLAISIIRQ